MKLLEAAAQVQLTVPVEIAYLVYAQVKLAIYFNQRNKMPD